MTHPQQPQTQSVSDHLGEEVCTYKAGDTAPVSLFDNYKWRGRHLDSLSLVFRILHASANKEQPPPTLISTLSIRGTPHTSSVSLKNLLTWLLLHSRDY
jgi:hypothetical protein